MIKKSCASLVSGVSEPRYFRFEKYRCCDNTRNLNLRQAQTVNLGTDGKGSGLSQVFKTLPNAATPDKPDVINLDLSDGTANMTLRVQGDYVNGQDQCVSKKLGIKINGDMYDDY